MTERSVAMAALCDFVYWIRTLRDYGCPGDEDRARLMAEVLVENDFTKASQLSTADPPRTWIKIDRLNALELDFLSSLGRRARSRSR